MEYRKFGNTIIARLDKGEEILEQLQNIAVAEIWITMFSMFPYL